MTSVPASRSAPSATRSSSGSHVAWCGKAHGVGAGLMGTLGTVANNLSRRGPPSPLGHLLGRTPAMRRTTTLTVLLGLAGSALGLVAVAAPAAAARPATGRRPRSWSRPADERTRPTPVQGTPGDDVIVGTAESDDDRRRRRQRHRLRDRRAPTPSTAGRATTGCSAASTSSTTPTTTTSATTCVPGPGRRPRRPRATTAVSEDLYRRHRLLGPGRPSPTPTGPVTVDLTAGTATGRGHRHHRRGHAAVGGIEGSAYDDRAAPGRRRSTGSAPAGGDDTVLGRPRR